jgi:hypothetical protein
MNPAALVCALAAVVVFLWTLQPSPVRWCNISTGLALLTVAWILQMVWQTTQVTIH